MKGISGWRLVVGGLLLVVVLTSCAPDPRKEAQAEKIRLEAQQAAKDAEQAREVRVQQAQVEQAQADYRTAVMQSTTETAKVRANTFVDFIGRALTVAACVIVMGFGWTVKETSIGVGKALVQYAELKALTQGSLIHMDKKTHTFPARLSVVDGTQFLTMLSTGQTFRLDTPLEANPRLVAALAQVATAGMLADNASKKGADAVGIGTIQPTVIDLEGAMR